MSRSGGRKRGKPPRKQAAVRPKVAWIFEYYTRPFQLLHADLSRGGYDGSSPHEVRRSYWSLVPPGRYDEADSRGLLLQYARVVEERIRQVVSQASMAYWLHLYRRIAPLPVVERDSEITIGITRAVMEAAFQKFGRHQPCNRLAASTDIPLERVLGGLLVGTEFKGERQNIQQVPQWVLTEFSTDRLRELYDLEKLAFEVWRAGAQVRCVAKGAPLYVLDSEERVADGRSEALGRLISSYDERCRKGRAIDTSATGTVFGDQDSSRNQVLLPAYNVNAVVLDERLAEWMQQAFGVSVAVPFRPNFLLLPYDLAAYRSAHRPFSAAFQDHHGVSLDSVLVVLASLYARFLILLKENPVATVRTFFQRAYEGPFKRGYVSDEVGVFRTAGARLLNMTEAELADVDIDAGMAFWELNPDEQRGIDLVYPGPHAVFLPFGDDRFIVDYAWILRRLYDLFIGVAPADQNFKAWALESVIREGGSELPATPCTGPAGDQKQVDAAFRVGDRLVIVECRAAGKSIGFDRGDPRAIQHRQDLVERTLGDVDKKARWLAAEPKGRNYDISWAREIIPVGVTPFTEFIPSLEARYWLADSLPRVLTPDELREALADGSMARVNMNVVPVRSGRQLSDA